MEAGHCCELFARPRARLQLQRSAKLQAGGAELLDARKLAARHWHSCWCTNTAVLALDARIKRSKNSDGSRAALLASVLHTLA